MNSGAKLKLAEDLRFVERRDLDAGHLKLPGSDSDYVITRERSRASSSVVSPALKEILELFQEASTVIDAILRYCSRYSSEDPGKLLDELYPALIDIVRAGHLRLVETSSAPRANAPEELVEASFGHWRVVRRIQALDDSSVSQVIDSLGRLGALKTCNPNADGRALLRHEARMLEGAPSALVPRVLAVGDDPAPHVITEWINGVPIDHVANELREAGDNAGLFALTVRLCDAYAQLHATGVCHGDVHPANVVVDADGKVTLIDFAFATHVDDNDAESRTGGIGFYLPPEVASRLIAHAPWPRATPRSEQYCVATLVYQLLAGEHYLSFSLERSEMLKQIENEAPRAFTTATAEAFAEMQPTLLRALSKNPADRFKSMDHFARELARTRPAPVLRRSPPTGRAFADAVLDKLLASARDLEVVPLPPSQSLNYGRAGIAYFLYRMASHRCNGELLAAADLWLTAHPLDEEGGFTSEELGITPKATGPISLLHSQSGVELVRALVCGATHDMKACANAIERFVQLQRPQHTDIEFALGHAGILTGCSHLIDALGGMADLDLSSVYQLASTIVDRLDHQLREPECRAQLGNGFAHGISGVLWSAFRWCRVTGLPPRAAFIERTQELVEAGERTGRGLRWPIGRAAGRSYMPSWCNGTAGIVLALCEASEVAKQPQFLETAALAGFNCLDEPAGVAGLCCGVAGQAYAFLELANATGDARWHARARVAADSSLRGPSLKWRPDSLLNGEPGVALLHEDLDQQAGGFPLLERYQQ